MVVGGGGGGGADVVRNAAAKFSKLTIENNELRYTCKLVQELAD